MTEKQYSLVYYADKGGTFIRDNKNSIEWYHDSRASLLEIVDKLNELADENEQLKKQLSKINQLIYNKIDEFKNGDYGDLPCNTIHMFLDLKEEIGDVE